MKLNRSAGIWGRFRSTFIGDRAFYIKVLTLIVPIILQNLITNFVNLLDNVMIGQVGTAQMSGVAIANQLIFVANLTVFGGLSGPGIYGAQFFGAGDNDGLRHTLRFKIWTAVVIMAGAIAVFSLGGSRLISLYLTGEGDKSEAAEMLSYGLDYLRIMVWGLIPFALSQAYGGTLRETGEAMLPMKASIAAVFTNLVLNYILIFGKLGFPELGVVGAAIATVISRYVELAIMLIYTRRHIGRFSFIRGLFSSMRVPLELVKNILKKGMPLLVNELLWSLGVTTTTQIFSTCGLNVVAGLNISSTVTNLFNVVFISIGSATAVMVGQALGASDIDRAKSYVWKLIFFNFGVCLVIGAGLGAASPFIPDIYKTTEDVRKLATLFMLTSALYMPINSITHICYFAIRSGGKTIITFLFDSAYTWAVCIPLVYALAHFSGLGIAAIYPLSFLADTVKSVIGIIIVRTGYWAQNVVSPAA
ncbi:MAG: MATE family efflux transporter [Oscillospiraceae bacterium]|jgi:putative MATE family efflux protein